MEMESSSNSDTPTSLSREDWGLTAACRRPTSEGTHRRVTYLDRTFSALQRVVPFGRVLLWREELDRKVGALSLRLKLDLAGSVGWRKDWPDGGNAASKERNGERERGVNHRRPAGHESRSSNGQSDLCDNMNYKRSWNRWWLAEFLFLVRRRAGFRLPRVHLSVCLTS